VYKGVIWELTIPGYLIVDEFESYTDNEGGRIYEFWIDGLTTGASNSTVGYMTAPFAERTILHGGKQSMPMDFNNLAVPYFSEAEREFDPAQNWTGYNAESLSLWFKGYPLAYAQTDEGSFTMSAGGRDIWDLTDECRFAYKRLSGNGSIVARVDSLVMTNGWAKAGVMIRESLASNAKHAAVVMTPSNGVSFPYRPYTNDVSYQTNVAGLRTPYWVRLTRTGDVFKAEYSANGTAWIVLGTEQTILMNGTVYIGLCLTSTNRSAATSAQYSNVVAAGGTGSWLMAEIGIDHPGNIQDELYVKVEDSAGKSKKFVHPDPAAVLINDWTEWKIPLSSIVGVNVARIKKVYIGVGDGSGSTPNGAGRIFIDDIRVTGP
jgi:regulation of enolase protein 1 (concanavalin A-like superfamily)